MVDDDHNDELRTTELTDKTETQPKNPKDCSVCSVSRGVHDICPLDKNLQTISFTAAWWDFMPFVSNISFMKLYEGKRFVKEGARKLAAAHHREKHFLLKSPNRMAFWELSQHKQDLIDAMADNTIVSKSGLAVQQSEIKPSVKWMGPAGR